MAQEETLLFNRTCLTCRHAAQVARMRGYEAAKKLLRGHPRCPRCGILVGKGHVVNGIEECCCYR